EARDQHGRVGDVLLLDTGELQQLHGEESVIVVALAQERAELWIAVEAREAGPDDLPPTVDERADRAVPDQGQIERRHGAARCCKGGDPMSAAASWVTAHCRRARARTGRRDR